MDFLSTRNFQPLPLFSIKQLSVYQTVVKIMDLTLFGDMDNFENIVKAVNFPSRKNINTHKVFLFLKNFFKNFIL